MAIASAVIAIVIIIVGVFGYLYFTGYGGSGGTTSTASPLISYSADAYATETTALLAAFSRSTGIPAAPVLSGGSFADANKIAAGAPDDIFVSAALSATGPQYLKSLASNWTVGFATDQIVLAYSNASSSSTSVATIIEEGNAASQSNTTSDWNSFFTSLASGGVKVGISDPVADPAGLRAWIALEAAGFLYAGGNASAYIVPILKTASNVTGTSAAALVAPLQSGQIQFLFTYKSAAVANGLGYLKLDRHVNLGDPALGTFYSKFSYKDSAGTTVGAPIVLSVTVPLSSSNTSEALQFVQFVVENSATLSAFGLEPLVPALLYSNTSPPSVLVQLETGGWMVSAGSLP